MADEQDNLSNIEGEVGAIAEGEELLEVSNNQPAAGDLQQEVKVQNLDLVLDVPLKVSVELGQTDVSIRDLLQLRVGSVIELNKLAGEPLEVLINSNLVAKGEVVVANEKFGIRFTDIIDPTDGKERSG